MTDIEENLPTIQCRHCLRVVSLASLGGDDDAAPHFQTLSTPEGTILISPVFFCCSSCFHNWLKNNRSWVTATISDSNRSRRPSQTAQEK